MHVLYNHMGFVVSLLEPCNKVGPSYQGSIAIHVHHMYFLLHTQGDGVMETMQMLCANNVDIPVGKIVYTGMLNERGGYETDCTVTRTAPNKLDT